MPEPISNNIREYLTDELNFLRNQINEIVNECVSIEKYALTLAGIILSWCAVENSSIAVREYLVWFPVLTTMLLGIRAFGRGMQIEYIKKHIRKIICELEVPEDKEWIVHHYVNNTSISSLTSYFFWFVLHAVTILVAIFFHELSAGTGILWL